MASAQADENRTKIDLQASLLSFLDASADSQGRFGVIDRESGKIIHVHTGAMHPKIVPFGEDRILCIEMFDSEGGRHDAALRRDQRMVVARLLSSGPMADHGIATLRRCCDARSRQRDLRNPLPC